MIRQTPNRPSNPTLVFILTFGALIFIWRDVLIWNKFGTYIIWFSDDFFYYYVVARNFVSEGFSSFDGQVATNGYHPLWMLLVSGIMFLFGESTFAIRALEVCLLVMSLWIFLKIYQVHSFSSSVIHLYFFFWATKSFALNGMETTLLVFTWTALVSVILRHEGMNRTTRTALLCLLGPACIGARIDAAVFVLPLLWLVTVGRERAVVFAALVVAGAVYATGNLIMFGLPLPISASVKSLGGIQLNTRFLSQLQNEFSFGGIIRGNILTPIIFMVASPALFLLAKPRTVPRKLVLAFFVGSLLFGSKLIFGSSWYVWPWYSFPLYFGVMAIFLIFHQYTDYSFFRRPSRVPVRIVATAMLLHFGSFFLNARMPSESLFALVNRDGLAEFRPVLKGAQVAMGDRAGSLAYLYDGNVTQLEGLVNDREYLDVLKSGGDVRALLCRRSVRFVLSFERDLGEFEAHEVETIRSALSSYDAPRIRMTRQDLLGVHSGAGVYNKPDNMLHLWRLDCPASEGLRD